MRKRSKIRKTIIIFTVVTLLCVIQGVYAEDGILPSLTEAYGISMPSPGEALQVYPDSETKNEDGSVTYLYSAATEEDYNAFSVYLKQNGAELADYKMEDGVVKAIIQVNNVSFSFIYDTGNYDMKVTYPDGTSDIWVENARKHFSYAQKLLELGRTEEAFAEVFMIPQYMDYAPVKELLKRSKDLEKMIAAYEEKIESYKKTGSLVTFGKYEQDNDAANGPEDIQWVVLDYDAQGNKALLISQYCLTTRVFSDHDGDDVTWETCTLRQWLNESFLSAAFTTEEQKAILTTEVDNSASQGCREWNQDGSNNTRDQVFILSYREANQYYGTQLGLVTKSPRASLTPYAASTDEGMENLKMSEDNKTADGEPAARWWLRSPGEHGDSWWSIMDIASDGMPMQDGALNFTIAVRPVFWLDLNSSF